MQKYIGGLLVLFAVGLAACSGGGSTSGGNAFAISGLAITTPTPTLPPTPIPSPTATPVNALNDGDFASGAFSATAGWTACSIAHPGPISTASPPPAPFAPVGAASIGAVIVSPTSPAFQVAKAPAPATTPAVFGNAKFAALTFAGTGAETTYPAAGGGKSGTAGANGICQTITLPANATLTMFVNEGGSDTGLDFADQEADIIPTTGPNAGTAIPLFLELNDPPFSGTDETGGTPAGQIANNGGTYVMKGPYALTGAPYNLTAGQTVQLFIGAFDSEPSSSFGVYMFVDDVLLTNSTTAASIHHSTLNNRTSSK